MKKNILFAAVLSLFVLAVSALAQDSMTASVSVSQTKTGNFAGTWTLDASKSKLGDRNMIESQTLTVTQTEKDITVVTATKRLPPPADAPQGGGGMPGGMGGGRGMGGMMGGGDGTKTYVLDGKEVKSEMQGPQGSMPVATKAKVEGGKLHISTSSTFTSPMGEVTVTSKETWEIGADGALTVKTDRETPRGSMSTTKVFVKKS